MTREAELAIETTGIGSLPHPQLDAALQYAFRTSVPFLPQVPIRNAWEFMIAQSLEGLPGLQVEEGGLVSLDLAHWSSRARRLDEKLETAFRSAGDPHAFEAFEPTAASSSCWQPFLWELEERKARLAKIQLAGPLTSQWAIRLRDGSRVEEHADLTSQIFRLVLARALAMGRRVRETGADALLFLDEPGLFALTRTDPRHVLAMQELKLMIQALGKEGIRVGIHCCSNTEWDWLLGLGAQVISLDAELSLSSFLATGEPARQFLDSGGTLSLGVIPTPKAPGMLERLEPAQVLRRILAAFRRSGGYSESEVHSVLGRSLFTPSCGLALHTTSDAETALALLEELRRFLKTELR
jgi:hypothetical protein